MICESCKLDHDGSYGSGRFCKQKCARSFSTKENRLEINQKVSKTLSKKDGYYCKKCGAYFETHAQIATHKLIHIVERI